MHYIFKLLSEDLTPIKPVGLPKPDADAGALSGILNIAFGIAGALALLVIVVSGLRYVTSAGDPEKASKAKNGIVYALIGLLILISARAIVAFVANRVS